MVKAALAPLPDLTGTRPLLMGIVNVTPDSFSDGGRFATIEAAVARAHAMVDEGAAFIDVGGESTRPGFTPVSADEERARVMPVIEALGPAFPLPLSIDTTKSAIAKAALAGGARVVNDIWGLQADPAMATVVAEADAAVVIMHNRADADPSVDIIADMERFFETSLAIAARAGIRRDAIVLDPGIGFGKTPQQQIEAIRAIPRLRRAFGLPILAGLSRKSVLRHITGSALDQRLPDTLAANLAAYLGGARLFRVHDVGPHAAAFAVFAALRPEVAA